MILKKEVIERVRGRKQVQEFATHMDTTQPTMYRWMESNKDEGPLTTHKSLTWLATELECDIEDLLTDLKVEELKS